MWESRALIMSHTSHESFYGLFLCQYPSALSQNLETLPYQRNSLGPCFPKWGSRPPGGPRTGVRHDIFQLIKVPERVILRHYENWTPRASEGFAPLNLLKNAFMYVQIILFALFCKPFLGGWMRAGVNEIHKNQKKSSKGSTGKSNCEPLYYHD